MLGTDVERVPEAPGAQERVLDRFFGVRSIAEDQTGGPERGRIALLEPVFEPVFHHPPL